ncbi:hypothetical protein ABVY47_003097 [Vibrio parahaemolyticus]|uniref:hypothetical protein n=1 Tax=Vibrio TaxID=662 RepID=UPI000812C0D1|nr:hypothetical protein [Vibrio parahaemolyticus]EGQ7682490.1 hypothetical protein [Vibrio parahaemolyticus]EGQ8047205.1 hypothetical protein [Vibrio parahaemolyticus]EGQ8957462.1 hypothetical protein [Vibrio parahaemolyticus]EGR3230307.1 hypothetical protein [Vibrio parahaemolyticus]EHH2866197.1 hypothetical protein [Vibrio parahaemolyticus]
MSKKVKLGVVSALSVAVLTGCQSTGSQSTAQPEPYSGEMTRTEETNLLRYRDTVDIKINWDINKFPDGNKWSQMSKGFKLSEPLSFEFPLTQILDCGERNNGLNTQKGTLTITKAESVEKSSATRVHGYVTSDEFDVSECSATVEFMVKDTSRKKGLISLIAEGPDQKPAYGTGFARIVYPKLKEMKEEVLAERYNAVIQGQKQEKLASWHVQELTDTAQAIGMIEVCMEKGTYFLPNDRRAKRLINESESYAKNDIHSKVTGKHYWDSSVYKKQRRVGLIAARDMWEHSYLEFSNMCAAFRNAADSVANN